MNGQKISVRHVISGPDPSFALWCRLQRTGTCRRSATGPAQVGSALRCELKRQAAAIALQLVNPVGLDWIAVPATPDCAEQHD